MPVPPAMKTKRSVPGSSGNVKRPSGPSTSTRAPGSQRQVRAWRPVIVEANQELDASIALGLLRRRSRASTDGVCPARARRRGRPDPGGRKRTSNRRSIRTTRERGVAGSTSRIGSVSSTTHYAIASTVMSFTRRVRGAVLRLVRRRRLSLDRRRVADRSCRVGGVLRLRLSVVGPGPGARRRRNRDRARVHGSRRRRPRLD